MDRTCVLCGVRFNYPYLLKRHQARTTSCVHVAESPPEVAGGDPPTEKSYICPKCGKSFTFSSNMYRHKGKCVGAADLAVVDTGTGADVKALIEIVRMQQMQIDTLARVSSAGQAASSITNSAGVAVLGPSVHNHIHMAPVVHSVHINFWGQEDLTFLDRPMVKNLLIEAVKKGIDVPSSSEWLYNEVMRRAIADPARPENLTAYIPNKREGDPIVHEESGWNRQPRTDMTYVPVVSRVLDKVFMNQPHDENHVQYGEILVYLRKNERVLAGSRAVSTLLENNKIRLGSLLGLPPPIGAPPVRREDALGSC